MAVRYRDRPWPAVLADLVEGVIVAGDLRGSEAERIRAGLWRAQTPQAFRIELLIAAHRQAAVDGFVATDDAALVERLGAAVAVVESPRTNIKVTTPDDLVLAEHLLGRESTPSPREP